MVNSAPALWPVSFDKLQYVIFGAARHQHLHPDGNESWLNGRTRSGKSSLLLSMVRLIGVSGESMIRIAGLDICSLPRKNVRSRVITVPQDPMLVQTDSVRQNLDIAGASISDDDMIAVLDRVGLWKPRLARSADVVESLDSSGSDGSDSEGDDDDNKKPSLSETTKRSAVLGLRMKRLPLPQGQQQLFSLACAVLMRSLPGA
ncbi:hypothetical protein LLEC1_02601 [Akanthomyces lecanii]|uniref:ABC transporter domain-containing protein n=1 Tax=Cordyceps confragosa TaxID=2714763 RepID=A0A179IGS1_CORDF|nr:hypothetical protein LLEC1_02601 [Akanthomyces lecanii]